MRNPFARLRKDERGMAFVYVGLGFMAFMTATTIAIDVGMFMTARTQAQSSADAGALAGAIALAFNDYDDRSATGPAVQSAINASSANIVMSETVSVKSGDVTFLVGPSGLSNRVHVKVYRTEERDNPVDTLIASIFGIDHTDIVAEATAEASRATKVKCVKPFLIPDRWTENQTGPWSEDDTFEMFDNHGNPLANPDSYNGDLNSPNYTGYNPIRDKGIELILRAGSGNNIEPTAYFSWNMPGNEQGVIGADWYQSNISSCNLAYIKPGQMAIQEPGNMVGPTTQGIDLLIAQDPDAIWDTSCQCVKNSKFGTSPRVFPIPLYDPAFYAAGKANGRNADFRVANWLGFFATKRVGNQIYGRITPIAGEADTENPPINAGAFAIRLVE